MKRREQERDTRGPLIMTPVVWVAASVVMSVCLCREGGIDECAGEQVVTPPTRLLPNLGLSMGIVVLYLKAALENPLSIHLGLVISRDGHTSATIVSLLIPSGLTLLCIRHLVHCYYHPAFAFTLRVFPPSSRTPFSIHLLRGHARTWSTVGVKRGEWLYVQHLANIAQPGHHV